MVFEPEAIGRLGRRRRPVTPVEPPEPLPEFEPETIAREEFLRERPELRPPELRPPELPKLEVEDQVAIDELLGRIYEGYEPLTLSFIMGWAAEQPEAFLEDIQRKGRTEDTELLLELFGAKPEDIEEFFAPPPTPEPLKIPEGGYKFTQDVEGIERLFTISKDYLVKLDDTLVGKYNPDTGLLESWGTQQTVVPVDGIRKLVTITPDNRAYDENNKFLGTYNSVTNEIDKVSTLDKATEVWDALIFGSRQMWELGENYFLSALPNLVFQSTPEEEIPEFAKDFGHRMNSIAESIRDKFRSAYTGNKEEYEGWLTKNVELQPRIDYAEGVTEHPELIKDPWYWAYEFANIAPFCAAVVVSAATAGALTGGNPLAMIVGGAAVVYPVETQGVMEALLANGASEQQAAEIAAPAGIIIASLESLGRLPLLKAVSPHLMSLLRKETARELGKLTARELLKKGIKTAGATELSEVITEVLQEATQNAAVRIINENQSLIENLDVIAAKTAIATAPLSLFGGGLSMRRVAPSETQGLTDIELEAKGFIKEPESGAWFQPIKVTEEEITPTEVPTVPVIPEVVPEATLPLEEISKYETRIPLDLIRKDEAAEIERLTGEIEKEGITEPITIRVREDGSLIVWDGIHRLIVAQDLGIKNIPIKYIGEVRMLPKPPAVKVPTVPEVPEVIGEGGIPVPLEEPIPQGVIDNNPIIRDIGAKEVVRPTRKVFERMGLYETYKGIQRAEVEIGEERVARQKEQREIMKSVGKDKDRWSLIFDEANEKGSVVGLTFNEKRAVNYVRNWADEWAERKNLPKEKRIKDYIPHLFEQEMVAQFKETGKISPELANILSEKVAKHITDPFLKERLGAVGFLKDPFRAMEAYDAASLRVLYYEPFLQKIASIGNDPAQPRAVRDYLKDYSRRMTGEPAKLDAKINSDIQELASKLRGLPGGAALASYLERGNVSGLVAYQYTGAIYALWLGFKPTSAIRNLSQHTLIIGEVGPVHFADGIRLRFTKEGKAALNKSLVLRSRKAAFVPGIDDSFAEQWTDKFRETALWMFRMADKQNVSDAFLAGYSEAKSLLPDADEQAWIDRGDEVAADTQYLYTKMNSMALSQSSMGRVFSILTTWAENWMELMTKWVSRRPSQVYLEHERETGEKVKGANWATSYKAIGIYLVLIGLGYALKEETRLKAWEYTGITSIRYLADVIGGDFPGLQAPGAIANMVAGFVTDDERRFKEGWYDFKSTFTPGIIRQLNAVMAGDKDWLTLLFYLEGRNYKFAQLKDKWKKDFKPYNELAPKDRAEYRENNPKIEAKLFVTSQFTTLSTNAARAEVLRLIEEHDLDVEMIDGYEKVFGVDTKAELDKFQGRVGNLEKLEIGVEAEYYTMNDFASEVNTLVRNMGRTKVEQDGNQLAIEYLRAKDLFVQYDSLGEADARKQYRQQFPDVEASLYLWGRITAFENPNSAVELLRLMKKYDIPPEGIRAFVDDPAKYDALQAPLFQLQLEWNDLLVQYELANIWERKRILEENPEFRDARRHIEAINKGIPAKLVNDYIKYYTLPTTGFAKERFLADHDEFYQMMVDSGALKLKDLSIIPSEEFLKSHEEYMALETKEEKQDYLDQHPKFRRERRRQDAYSLGFGRFDIESINIPALDEAIAILKKARATHPTTTEWDIKWIQNYNVMIERLESARDGVWERDARYDAYNLLLEDIRLDTRAAEMYEKEGDTRRAKIYRDAVAGFEQVKELFIAIFDVARAEDRLVAQYVEYYELPLVGYRRERYLLDNPEFAQIMHDKVGIKIPEPSDVLPEAWDKIYEQYKAEFDELLGIADPDSEFYIEDIDNREEAREMMRFDKAGNPTDFFRAEKTLDAYSLKFPDEQIDNYIGYYIILAKGKPEGQDLWYDDDWYLQSHKDFYQLAKELVGWDERDFSKVPTKQVFTLYQKYQDLPKGGARINYRLAHSDLDDWLVLKFGYTPAGQGRGTTGESEEVESGEEPTELEEKLEELLR